MAALSATVAVAFGVLLYAFSVLVTDRAAGSEFSTGILSTAYGGTVLVGGGLAFLIGRFVDQRGVRLVMGAGAVTGAAGLAALSAARSNWQVLAAAWLLIGPAGAMTFYEPAFVAVDQWFAPAERGRAIGILTVVGGLAGPIFLPLTAGLVESVGWRATALVLGLSLAVTGLLAAGLALPAGRSDRHQTPPTNARLRELLRDRRFVTYTASVLLLFGVFQTVIFHRIALFEDAGFGIAFVSFWAGVSGWLSFPGRYAGPVLGSGPNGARWNAAVTGLLALTLIPMLVAGETGLMILHFLTFGVVFGAVLPMRAAVMSEWFSGPDFGRIMGIQWTLAAFAGGAGPFLAGLTRDQAGTYDPAIGAMIVVLTVAAGLTLLASRCK
ncbi:MAG TPA: MFS transporter [Acidimicrobiia bacterium]|nr:MFS transporter [Acidimicrobiia bacterium]